MELEEQCREEEKQHWARVAALIQVHFTHLPFTALKVMTSPRLCGDFYRFWFMLVFRGTRRQLPPTKAWMKG